MKEELSLQSLNLQIKKMVKKLNENVMLQIQVLGLRDELVSLSVKSEQLQEILDQAKMETHMDSQQYMELINDPKKLKQKFEELYVDLKFKFPNTHPTQWFIPPLFDTKLPELPRPSIKQREFSVKVVTNCVYGYRCTKMRYHFVRCWSKRAALEKIEELSAALQDHDNVREVLLTELNHLELEILRLTEGVKAKEEQIQGRTWLYESVFEYRKFCNLAKAYFQRHHSQEFEELLDANSSGGTLPSVDASLLDGQVTARDTFLRRRSFNFHDLEAENMLSEPSSVDNCLNYCDIPDTRSVFKCRRDDLSMLYH